MSEENITKARTVFDEARIACEKETAPAQAAHDKACEARYAAAHEEWAIYDKATAPARAVYDKACETFRRARENHE